MLTEALLGVDQHSGAMPAPSSKIPDLAHSAWSTEHSMMSEVPTMPRTWSDWSSLLAAAAICAGWVWSVWTKYLIGWPLTPPLSLTQVK